MTLPTWDEFCALFAAPYETMADRIQAAFLEKYQISVDLSLTFDQRQAEYRSQFMAVYGIRLDGKDGMVCLLAQMEKNLGNALFSVQTDEARTQGRVSVDGKRDTAIFHDCRTGDNGFEAGIERLYRLLDKRFDFLRRNAAISDALELLLLPAGWYARAEQRYGSEKIAAYALPYGTSFSADDVQNSVTDKTASVMTSEAPDQKKQAESEPEKSSARKKGVWGLPVSLLAFVLALVKLGVLTTHSSPDLPIDPVSVSVPDSASDADPASDADSNAEDNSAAYCEAMRRMARQTVEAREGEQSPGQADTNTILFVIAPQCE